MSALMRALRPASAQLRSFLVSPRVFSSAAEAQPYDRQFRSSLSDPGYEKFEDLAYGEAPVESPEPYSYVPPGRHHLFVPGPVNIHENVQRAMQVPGQNHRDPWFAGFYKKCLEDVKWLYQSKKGTAIIFPGTGTGGWEACLTNTLSPGDKVLTFRYGQFSHLWVDMMERLGLDVTCIDVRWGDGADEAKIEEILKADTKHEYKAVCVVHNETTTGVTSDIKGCRDAIDAAGHPAMFFVDGVSSIGGSQFKFDEWGVDCAVTGSQKALSLPTGLGFVCVSDKALKAYETSKMKKVYYDFGDMLATNPRGSVPYTPVLPLLHGLRESIALMRAEGMRNVNKRHARLAAGTREAAKAWGLELLCTNPRWYSDSLTVVKVPEGVDSCTIVKYAYSKYNMSLGVGLSQVKHKVFRIGHLGNMDEVMLLGALAATEMCLIDSGVSIVPGSGVGAALSYFQKHKPLIPTRELPEGAEPGLGSLVG